MTAAGTAAIVGLAGCSGGNGGGSETTTTGEGGGGEETPWTKLDGVSEDQFKHGPVPDAEKTAKSLGGETRNPDHLSGRDAVKFQEASKAVSQGLAKQGHKCENCAEFVPDGNGDGFGACTKVEGYIGPDMWCTLWEATDSS